MNEKSIAASNFRTRWSAGTSCSIKSIFMVNYRSNYKVVKEKGRFYEKCKI